MGHVQGYAHSLGLDLELDHELDIDMDIKHGLRLELDIGSGWDDGDQHDGSDSLDIHDVYKVDPNHVLVEVYEAFS